MALVEERSASTWPPTLKLRRAKGLEERSESIRDLRSGSRSLDVGDWMLGTGCWMLVGASCPVVAQRAKSEAEMPIHRGSMDLDGQIFLKPKSLPDTPGIE